MRDKMNTNAMISLDELVNKPEMIIKKLEKYSELVLIWNNEPYCVVKKVIADEDGLDSEEVSLEAEKKPLPIASVRFAEKAAVEREARKEFVSSDAWFAGESEPPVEEEQTFVPEAQTEQAAQEQVPQPEHVDVFAPPSYEVPSSDEQSFSLQEHSAPQESALPDRAFDYVPYEVLKKQHANLWDVMAQVLAAHPQHTMHAVDLARVINEQGLYKTRDGKPVTPVQIRARVGHRPDRFQALGGNLIRWLGV